MKIKAFCKGNKLVKVVFDYEFNDLDEEELFFKGYDPCDEEMEKKLMDSFNGKKVDFSDNIDLNLFDMSDFEKKVLKKTFEIPWGEIRTYKEIGNSLNSIAYRAVGNALSKCPIAIAIPCHRVIGSDRTLRGFGGRNEMKKEMLKNEGFKFKKDKIVKN